ncbi:threonine ammonia-lyase [Clostridium sp. BSD9I1]|uniref:threonine ammonia-lyase n=1 Tax=Clostridium sp. BSD9I1 TaxID=2003589 RepID=UPI001648B314|nr:threonine ammonia-lyase [Clostridium sp. BSD9I1]
MQLKLNLDMVKKAQENIKGVARKTPLFYSSTFSNITGYNIYLKCEDKQKTGSFKLRGAYNKVCCLTEDEKKCGVIASSAGNHAQGVAYAATAFGVKSTIFMPITAPMAKVNATKGYGAEVVQFGEVYDDCYNKAIEMQKTTGATFLHPFNDDEVMAGQGTIALEVFEELPEVDTIIAPIGGGGLISGIAVAAKALKPSIKIIGVQAEIIASTKASLEAGKVTTVPGAKSLADGISVMTPGDKTFEYIKKYVDEVVTVTEDEIALAMFSLMDRSKLIAEGAGATPLAALLAGKIKDAGKNVVSIISGGNIDIAMASKIIERELTRLRRRISFDVQLVDKVGQLGSLITLISKLGGNIIKVRQEQNWDEAGLDYANVKLVIATESDSHSDKILDNIKKNGYKLI